MARASLIQTNFSGGELSPAIALGRVDIAKYNNGARRIENCTLTIQGGAKRRPGTRFIRAQADEAAQARLVDFVYNRDQAYILEMGQGYIRFIRNRTHVLASGAPYQVTSPYGAFHFTSLNSVQKADTAFFVHESVSPYRLQRFGEAQWSMGPVTFVTEPFEEQGHFPNATLTMVNNTPGLLDTVTSSVDVFLTSDVGRHIQLAGGDAVIQSASTPSVVTVLVLSKFPSTLIPVGWKLDGSPRDSIIPSGKGEIGQTISLSANYTYTEPPKTIVGMGGYPAWVAVNVTAHGYAVGDTFIISDSLTVGPNGNSFNGTWVVDSVSGPDNFAFKASGFAGMSDSVGKTSRLDISDRASVWRAEDVGKYVQINGGLVRLTSVPNSSVANAEVLRPLSSTVPAGANAWTLESAAWSAGNGYPRAVTINAQRLVFGGSPAYPQFVWWSAIQEYLNFGFGTDDDNAFRYELDGQRNSPIRHLCSNKQLLVLTESDEMSVKGGQEKPVTPTNVQKTDESTAGAGLPRPIKAANEILFVQAAGRKINAAGYRYEIDGFASPDRTVFSSHITASGIKQLAFKKEPDSTILAVRNDGVLAVCAYDMDQEVTGWGRWLTKGAFESVATIPTLTGEDAYATVARTIQGQQRRYIEVFDPEVLLDCAITGTSVAGQATWNGLDHLEGEEVQAWADGAYMGTYTVAGGSVTLTRPANSVQIGLGFNCLVEMLQVEVGGNGTTAQGSQVHVNEVIIRVLETSAAVINGTEQEFRRFGAGLLDQPPPVFSGDVRGTQLSDEIFRTKQIIEQPYPLPFHLLDVIRRVTINEG